MLTVQTFDRNSPSVCYIIDNIKSITYTTAAEGGYLDANIDLFRVPGRTYNDIGFNYRMKIISDDGVIVWNGKIVNIPQPYNSDGTTSFNVIGVGDADFLSYRTSAWKPNYPTATEITTIVTAGIDSANANGISLAYSATTTPATGRSIIYQPGNYGSVRSHITEILKYGDSNNNVLTWQVWDDRVFYLEPRVSLSSPTYEINLSDCDTVTMGINSDNFYTRVTVQYRNAFDTVLTVVSTGDALVSTLPNYATIYGSYLGSNDSSATFYPFIREPEIIDITSHGVITLAQAQNVAASLLTAYCGNGVRLSSSTITIKKSNSLLYKSNGLYVDLPVVRAGDVVLIKDLSGADINLVQGQATMYINQTSVVLDENGLTLTLSGESQVSSDAMLSAMLSSIPIIPLSNGD